ncbi:Formate dehydrogenase chain D [Fulvivirga imtechensis AK7]|uniref:Sulfur carrier protein FdhD n=1 Tax=Fulvivirga imtechensis AK7 TaxID=1237149 RepID=L8JN26_9BACT|nr:formate dehydrogenase accessory sulfurtransferase FdhD [Fulvivirga imtechensis]ELR68929.1 Formate dehydrogenase chain D [Fulvivirga imtechensis AK7]
MSLPRVHKAEVVKMTGIDISESPDLVAVEEPLEIRIGYGATHQREQKAISVTMRTPGNDFELALGFLFTENIIAGYDQVVSIQYCANVGKQEERENVVRVELRPDVKIDFDKIERHFYTSSSCGVCSKTSIEAIKTGCSIPVSDLIITGDIVRQSPGQLREQQQVFEYTGGLHAAGLFDRNGNLVLMREDVGRHNALDKVLGACLAENKIPLADYFVMVSGRASFELVQKALMAGVPILTAIGAPSSLALKLAADFGMTLCGFVRKDSFNIYCGRERITN